MPAFFNGVRPSWIAFGWFIAAAVTALILLALVALGVISGDPDTEGSWVAAALVLGFGLAGYVVGTRVAVAPLAHGLGMGAFSLVVWIAANLLLGEPTDQTAWQEMSTLTAAALLVLQTVAAVVGARIGARSGR